MKDQHLTPEAAQTILSTLPDNIQVGIRAYADEIEFPIEAVLEMAIAGFLDQDSMSFNDCKPLSGIKFMKRAS